MEKSPNCAPAPSGTQDSASTERFVRPIKEECLDRLIPIGERRFRRAVAESIEHYHGERHHQGLDNRLIADTLVIDIAGQCGDVNGWPACSITTSVRRAGRSAEMNTTGPKHPCQRLTGHTSLVQLAKNVIGAVGNTR